MAERRRFIAVIGGSDCTSEEARLAEEVGREIARNGAVLVCGGLGGIMAAASKGASAEGGLAIGILPGDRREAANPHINIPVVTNLGEARNVIIVKSAEAVIAVGGGYGTLSEIGHALRNGTPVVGLNTWSLSRNNQPDNSIVQAKDPADAVKKALNMINDRS
jgi:uncharacterized protein (TIGR00725 family)